MKSLECCTPEESTPAHAAHAATPHWTVPAVLAVFGGLNNGYNMIVVAEILGDLRAEGVLKTPADEGLFVAAIGIGVVAMMPLGAYLADAWGRLPTVVVGESVVVVASLLQVACSSALALTFTRGLVGCGMALCVLLKPLYIAELSDPRHRGKMLTLFSVAFSVGVLLVAILGVVSGGKNWRTLLGVGAAPSLVLVVAAQCFLVESPIWEDMVNPEHDKEEVTGLTAGDALEHEELGHHHTRRKSQGFHCCQVFAELFGSATAGPTTLAAVLTGMQFEMDGVWMLIQYRNDIFEVAVGRDKVHVYAVAMCAALVLISIVPVMLVDTVGRRPLLKSGVVGSTLAKLIAAVGLSTGWLSGWPLSLFILLWALFAQFGISVTSTIIISEVFAPRHRSVGMCFTFMCMLSVGVLLNFAYRPGVEVIGHHGWMFLFAGASVAIAVPLLLVLPETKGQRIL